MKIRLFQLVLVVLTGMIFSCGEHKDDQLTDPEIDADVYMQLGHYWGISNLAFHPEMKYFATSGYDASIRLWDASTYQELKVIEKQSSDDKWSTIVMLEFNKDGSALFAGNEYGKIFLIETNSFTVSKTIEVFKRKITGFELNSDGSKFVVCSNENEVKVFESASGNNTNTLEGHTRAVADVSFKNDGKTVASCSNDSTVRIWNLEDNSEIKKIEFEHTLRNVQYTPDGTKLIINSSALKKIFILNSETYAEENIIEGYFSSLSINPEGTELLTLNNGYTQKWSLGTAEEIKKISNGGSNIKVSPDGKYFGNTDMTGVELWDYAEMNKITNFGRDVRYPSKVYFSESGKFLVTENSHISSIGGPDLLIYPIDTNYNFVAFGTSGSGANILDFLGNQDVLVTEKLYGDVFFYDLTNGSTIRGIEDKFTTPMCISPDGSYLVAKDKSNSSSYAIFDIETGEKKQELVNSGAYHYFSAFTPDGKYYAMRTMNFFKVWEMPAGTEVKNFSERSEFDNILFLANMADGSYMAGEEASGTFAFKNILTGAEVFQLDKKLVGSIKAAAISPDTKHIALASSDWTIKIYDLEKKAVVDTLMGHKGKIVSVSFSPDGKYLASCSMDKTTKLWDASNGKLLLTLLGLEKTSEYEGETKDYAIIAPNGRIDGTKEGIMHVLYMKKGDEVLPVDNYWDKIYTPDLLGKTLGQNFSETKE